MLPSDQQFKVNLSLSISKIKGMCEDAKRSNKSESDKAYYSLLDCINDLKQIQKSGDTSEQIKNSARLTIKHAYKLSAYIY